MGNDFLFDLLTIFSDDYEETEEIPIEDDF